MIPQLVWRARPSGQLVYANGHFLRYFDCTLDDLATWRLADHLHPDDVKTSVRTWRRCLASGESYEIEYRFRDRQGAFHWFLSRGMPYRSFGGEIAGWFGTSTPIDRQHERLERQRRVVDAFVQAFVPRQIPRLENVRIEGVYFAADVEAQVGGDWYDVLELEKGLVFVSIGDVIGHGVPAALSMAHIRQALLGAAFEERSPSAILQRANRIFTRIDSSIASAIVGLLDTARGRLRYGTAGHPPPIHASRAEATFLPTAGTLLGVGGEVASVDFEVELEPGSAIILYTDGLTEARRAITEDEKRLLAASRHVAVGTLSAADLHRAIVGPAPTRDDTAILTLRLAPTS
ncbi:MAG: SpoIIE family protein phosphatase [Candidatus Eremiobacteraeota bacterium]|nr:SpoIIE family protein phosphatase [Candidatus Eremiobacteraeota bacterium]